MDTILKMSLLLLLRTNKWVVRSYTIEINQLQIFCFYAKMNYFEMHLMVSSREVDSKVLQDGHSV